MCAILEREKKLIENNISIMEETVQLREQFETFKKETLEQIAKGMTRQQFASNIMQPQCKGKTTLVQQQQSPTSFLGVLQGCELW